MNPTEYRFPLHHSINRTSRPNITPQDFKLQTALAPTLPGIHFAREKPTETSEKKAEVVTPPRWHRFLASIPLVNWVLKKCSKYFKNAFERVDAYWKQEAAKPKGGGFGVTSDDYNEPLGGYLPYAAIGGVGLLPGMHHTTIYSDDQGIHPTHYDVTDHLHGNWGGSADFDSGIGGDFG